MRRFSLLTLFWLLLAWRRFPRARLGQLLEDSLWETGGSPWSAENAELRQALRATARRPRGPGDLRRPPARNVRRKRAQLALVQGGRR
jgi:hypothetical protein